LILLFIGHSPIVSSLLWNLLSKPDCLLDGVLPAISLEHNMSGQIFLRLFIFNDHFLIFQHSFHINNLLRFDYRCLLFLINTLVFDHSLRLILIGHFNLLYTGIYTSSFTFIHCFDSYYTIVLANVIDILCHSCFPKLFILKSSSFDSTLISEFLGDRTFFLYSINHFFFWNSWLSDLNYWRCLNFLSLFKLKAISNLFKILLEFAFALPFQV